MIYIPSFIKIGSGIQMMTEGDSQTHRQHGDLISLLLFFQNKESWLKSMAGVKNYYKVHILQEESIGKVRFLWVKDYFCQ
jgi:hypothetical protein